MSPIRRIGLGVFALIGALALAPAIAAGALIAVGDELAVGKNRTGETCRLRLVDIRPDQGIAVQHYRLFCEGWTQPSGEVPPEVLVTRAVPTPGGAPERADYRQVPFLGRQLPISVLPSIGSLRGLRAVAGRSSAPQPFIGFGDPAFAGAPGDTRSLVALAALCREGANVDRELVRDLPRLRESADELKQIARALHAPESDVVLGAQATENRVREMDLSRYRVVRGR